MTHHASFFLAIAVTAAAAIAQTMPSPPPVPVGLDAYRQWDRWPQQRIGVRGYMRSTYDHDGLNQTADASHFLYQEREDFNVTLDIAGPSILYFMRANHWHGSPWHFEVDGTDHIVTETSTATPDRPVRGSTFEPESVFPSPLTWTWSTTKGANLMWVPIASEKSLRIAYSRTFYGTGYYIYHQFVPGIPLSQPIKVWDGKSPPAGDVVELIGRAGSDLVPRVGTPEGDKADIRQVSGTASVPAAGAVELTRVTKAPSTLHSIELVVPKTAAVDFSRVRLRVTWDGRPEPSIDVPVALFYGAGVLYNRDDREYLVKAFPVNIRYVENEVRLACYFPMPFFKSAKLELVGAGKPVSDVKWIIRTSPIADSTNLTYFHATYKDHGKSPERGKDLVLLDTRQAEGGGDWSGSFVGTSFIFSHNAVLTTLEGDPRFYFDDAQTPQAYGTGTEEWGGGGDYWGGRNMTLPFAGHPCGAPSAKEAKNDLDKIQSAYRFLLADLMPFGKNARITLEHGGENESKEHYETVTYWYGAPAPSLVKTDELVIADVESERAHGYTSPQASEPYEIESRYEWGPSNIDGKEIYPAQKKLARKTAGTSEFTMKLDPNNHGVLLRRTLDYAYPSQRAEVFIADASSTDTPDWKPAGVWYLAGSNTCIYSNPREELGATQHIVQTSNRRFRDDEFLVGRDLTRGKEKIRVRVKFTPVDRPLFPGWPLMEQAWTEIRYDAYCFVMPKWTP